MTKQSIVCIRVRLLRFARNDEQGVFLVVWLVIFINLFFVPVLTLYMIHQRKQKPLKFNVEMLLQYCIIAACNIPLTKVFILMFKKLSGKVIPLDSGYYTLSALFSAVLLYKYYVSGLYEKHSAMLSALWDKLCAFYKEHYAYCKTYAKKSFWREKIAGRGIKRIIKELLPAYFVVLAACFMMFIYEPILLYSTNKNDFWFDFSIMITPLFYVWGGVFFTHRHCGNVRNLFYKLIFFWQSDCL